MYLVFVVFCPQLPVELLINGKEQYSVSFRKLSVLQAITTQYALQEEVVCASGKTTQCELQFIYPLEDNFSFMTFS